MEQIRQDVESFARIRVVGAGGSGNNAVNYMVGAKVKGVEFIAINSDAQDLHHSLAKKKIHIGKTLPVALVPVATQTWVAVQLKKLAKKSTMPSRALIWCL